MTLDVIPFPDTRAYVSEVVNLVAVYRRAYGTELGAAP